MSEFLSGSAVLSGSPLIASAGLPAPAFSYLDERSGVWIAAQFHGLMASLVVGTLILGVAAEWVGHRKRESRYERLAKELARVALVATVISAASGGVLLFALVAAYPGFTASLLREVAPIFEGVYPFLLIVFAVALVYYLSSWNAFNHETKGRHIAIGAASAVIGLATVAAIEGPLSFMHTPGKVSSGMTVEGFLSGTTWWDRAANQSWFPLSLHQLVSSLMLAGFVGGLVAAHATAGATTQDARAYYAWKGLQGGLVGLSALLLVPLTASYVAVEVCRYDDSICRYLEERLGMLLYLAGCQVAILLFAGNLYLWLGLKPLRFRRFIKIACVTAILCVAAVTIPPGAQEGVQAAEDRPGAYFAGMGFTLVTVKVSALLALGALTLWSGLLSSRAGARESGPRHDSGWAAQFLLVFLAFGATWLIALLGTMRSLLRQHFHVYNLVPDLTSQALTPTLAEVGWLITGTTLGFLMTVIFIKAAVLRPVEGVAGS